jgi:hypothetical protein
MAVTILTSFAAAGNKTSTISTRGRGYVHVQFRAGSAVSAPALSIMSLTMALQTKIPGSDELWCDAQTWSVVAAEIVPGRDYSHFVAESGIEARLIVKDWTAGICQGRIWEG